MIPLAPGGSGNNDVEAPDHPSSQARSIAQDQREAVAFRDLWSRDQLLWWTAASYVPSMVVILMVIAIRPSLSASAVWIVYVSLAWIVAYVIAMHYRKAFACPQCLQAFSDVTGQNRACASCGFAFEGIRRAGSGAREDLARP